MSNSCDGSILAGCLRAGPELRSEPSREGRASVSCNRAVDGLPRDTDICGLAVLGLGAVTRFIEMAENAPMEQALKLIPAQRMGEAREVAGLVNFLMSDEAAYITRQVISVNGGLC